MFNISRKNLFVVFYIALGLFLGTAFQNCSAKKLDFNDPVTLDKVSGLAVNQDEDTLITVVDDKNDESEEEVSGPESEQPEEQVVDNNEEEENDSETPEVVSEEPEQSSDASACVAWLKEQNGTFNDKLAIIDDSTDYIEIKDAGRNAIISKDIVRNYDAKGERINGPLYICGVHVKNLCRNSGEQQIHVASFVAGSYELTEENCEKGQGR